MKFLFILVFFGGQLLSLHLLSGFFKHCYTSEGNTTTAIMMDRNLNSIPEFWIKIQFEI